MTKTKEEIAKMTVPELKSALKALNLPVTGKKDELVDRLATANHEGGAYAPAAEPAPAGQPAPVANESAAPEAEATEPQQAQAQQADASGDAANAGDAPEAKRAKITFTEDAAKVAAATKVTVVNTAPAAASGPKTTVNEQERLKLREERFKDPNVEKIKERALRFGLSHPEVEKEKAKKRAERFGLSHPEIEDEKKKARMARFGIVDEDTKLKMRADRFKPLSGSKPAPIVSTDFEERKKARAERFAAAK
mmetsp:Transcript_30993/g.68725  ORF Transcript_30993/g.68725 Transcript_30993/m.68725 type:complete len:251 (-) Transcript_30993:1403-2155(-)|eukprot:CAMPEP_0202902604 /NCGR_PEP_ID=MMETSP1392-20130828/16950_1 /ASSEMBLY_ACC=CAM_ASM_000868 /TAXON_ID=225041 /ORGANISM="Chlamydomonas chlamydogama, Strain SAG 11-48b" /LENGTH=250 /DNA_ID=CAMNT_0049589393 /DNA_START=99 /DNA_END=851 /DNA_ORIENTATION=-